MSSLKSGLIRYSRPPSAPQAVIELLLTTCFWGFGFIIVTWNLKDIGPLWLCASRFLLAAILIAPFVFFNQKLRILATPKQALMAMGPGICLGATLLLQNTGLKYTTATNSGFITTLYALFVPLFGMLVFGRRVPWFHGILVLIALVGTGLICGILNSKVTFNRGDVYTLGCSFAATAHILWIGQISKRISSPFVFNLFQCFWSGAFSLLFALIFEGQTAISYSNDMILGIIFLTLFSTIFGFIAQLRAQKVLSPSVASIVFLLESPFAAAFAFLLLKERLEALQWLGAILIIGAAAATIRLEAKV